MIDVICHFLRVLYLNKVQTITVFQTDVIDPETNEILAGEITLDKYEVKIVKVSC